MAGGGAGRGIAGRVRVACAGAWERGWPLGRVVASESADFGPLSALAAFMPKGFVVAKDFVRHSVENPSELQKFTVNRVVFVVGGVGGAGVMYEVMGEVRLECRR